MALIAPEIGIDLGTSNTMVYVRGRGIVVSEPTIVVIDSDNKHNVRAVGDEAEILLGRTGDKLVAVRPLKAGSIVNFDMAEILLRYFIRKAIGVSHVIKPKVLVSVPCTLPMVARKAVTEAATPAVKATYDLVMSAPTVDAQNQLALLLLTYYRGIDTGRKMEQAKAEGKQTA